jgi:hypothetical protein
MRRKAKYRHRVEAMLLYSVEKYEESEICMFIETVLFWRPKIKWHLCHADHRILDSSMLVFHHMHVTLVR